MLDWLFGQTRTYVFTHAELPSISIRARSLDKAKRRLWSALIAKIYGDFALSYYPHVVKNVMDGYTLKEQADESS